MEPDPGAVRNFKDFLQLYNKMTEMCFQRCVVNVHVRKLDSEETKCVDNCSQKFITYNNRLMQSFVKAQGEIVNKRVKEAEEQQQILENQQKSAENQRQKELETQSKDILESTVGKEVSVTS
ncbi:mitochondrial import inner membrane translocase subunit Tim10 B [Euwallacea similis]|uniref:mitochondrial import inner membrane translocase subunit Tim10 B n=1 Tax=Euwallacea similis TaxID=1736056 RepID=UPI00344CD9E0